MDVKLSEIQEAISFSTDSNKAFLNKRTGEIEWLADFFDDEECKQISTRLQKDGFYELPSQDNVQIKQLLSDFIATLPSSVLSSLPDNPFSKDEYHTLICVFRHYKFEQDWNKILDDAFNKIAKEWCQEKGLSFASE